MERTLTIDDDVLTAVEELAVEQRTSVDQVISDLSRKALASHPKHIVSNDDFPGLPAREVGPITLEFVNELRDGTSE